MNHPDRREDTSLLQWLPLVVSAGVAFLYLQLFLSSLLQNPAGNLELLHLVHGAGAWLFVVLLGLASWYLGWFLLALFQVPCGDPVEAHFFRTAFGCGVLILFYILLLGLGILQAWIVLLILLLLGLPGALTLQAVLRTWRKEQGAGKVSPILLPSMLLLLFFFLLSLTPERDYDALEYHLPAAQSWALAGHFVEIPYNVYTNFPMNMEVLYAAGMAVAGDLAPKAIHLAFGFGAAWGTWLLGRRLGGAAVGRWALLLFVSSATVGRLMFSSLIDLGVSYFAVAMLLALLCIGREGLVKSAVLAGCYAGLALGCKYTSALSVVAPGLIVLILAMRQQPVKRRIAAIVLFGAAALILFMPWAIKNLVFKGNPVFPLFYNLFGGSGWDAECAALFMDAHRSALFRNPGNALADLSTTFIQWFSAPTVIVPSMLVAVLIFPWRRVSREGFYLWIYAMAGTVLWYAFTQGADRFLVPVFPAMAALAAFAADRVSAKPVRRLVLLVYMGFIALGIWGTMREAAAVYPMAMRQMVRGDTGEDYDRNPHLEAIRAVNFLAAQDPSVRVLFVGEARGYGCQAKKTVPTVFDRHPLMELTQDMEDVALARALRAGGYSHLLYNSHELDRLERGYGPHGWKDGPELRRKTEALLKQSRKIIHNREIPRFGRIVVFEMN